jgi:cell division inhibitor SepF
MGMAGFFDKILGLIGFEDEVIEEVVPLSRVPDKGTETAASQTGKGRVISLHNPSRMQVMVVEPTCFEDAKRVVDHLRGRKPVVVNLESTEEGVAQRIIDFISGASFTTNGNIQRVSDGIFLFAPNHIDIAAELKEAQVEDPEPPFLWAR